MSLERTESPAAAPEGRSLAWRLALAGLAALALTALGSGSLATSLVRRRAGESLRASGQGLGAALAPELLGAVRAGDAAALQARLKALPLGPSGLAYAAVRGPDGKLLASALPPDGPGAEALPGAAPEAPDAEAEGRAGQADVWTPIGQGGSTLGYLQLGASAPGGAERERALVGGFLARLLALALALGLTLLLLVRRWVVGPLAWLGGLARGEQARPGRPAAEFVRVARAIEALGERCRTQQTALSHVLTTTGQEAGRVLVTAAEQSQSIRDQALVLHETIDTLKVIAESSSQAGAIAENAIEKMTQSQDLSGKGEQAVAENIQAMELLDKQVGLVAETIRELSTGTVEVRDIVATVTDLTERSNVLAVNAALEAARAGDGGKGFAVVATEMRRLAEQSRDAAERIRLILGRLEQGAQVASQAAEEGRTRANEAAALARHTGTTIRGLAETISASASSVRQIAQTTQEQSIGSDQIVLVTSEVSKVMENAIEGIQRIEAGTKKLAELSRQAAGG